MQSGGTPRRGSAGFYGGEIPWAKIGDLASPDGIVHDTEEHITPEGLSAISGRLFAPGTLLLAMYGSVGKTAIAGCEMSTNQAILGIRPRSESVLDCSFLRRWLEHVQPMLVNSARGVTQANISKSIVANLEIPMVDISAQRRIALILDKADALRRKRFESIMLAERLHRSAFVEMFGDPVTNPKNWPIKHLQDLAIVRSGVMKGRNYAGIETVVRPYMRVANVQDGYLALDNIKSIEISVIEAEKHMLQSGDILLTEGGDPDKLGRGAIWRDQIAACVHQNHIFSVRPDNELLTSEFLSTLFGSAYGKRYFLRAAKQTTGIASINRTQLSQFPVLLPPLELQRDYARVVSVYERMRERFQEILTEYNNLFKSLAHRAFSGQL
jgi:type I restriction enzyme S subunit